MTRVNQRTCRATPLSHVALTISLTITLFVGMASTTQAADDTSQKKADAGLTSLITETPKQGFALAVKLSQKGVATTQPDSSVRKALRGAYAHDPNSLIAASQVVAIHFQTIAAANNYWRE